MTKQRRSFLHDELRNVLLQPTVLLFLPISIEGSLKMHPPRIEVSLGTCRLLRSLTLHSHPRPSSLLPSLSSRPTSLHAHQHQHPPHTRSAHHASEGRANRAARGPGKRLGAKKQATELVVPGNIIFRQKGTHWYPGENCGMGRDRTIFAKEKGFVVYYRDRWKNSDGFRKYIGVVFERGMTLPRSAAAPRVRRLGLLGRPRRGDDEVEYEDGREEEKDVVQESENFREELIKRSGKESDKRTVPGAGMRIPPSQMRMKRGYMYRESNASIGRIRDRIGRN